MAKNRAKKILQFLELLRNLDKRMVEIDETMEIQKLTDVYGECICKMRGWPIHYMGGYSWQFCEVTFAFLNGYRRALRDNGFRFENGLVKPINPDRDLPIGCLESYDDKLRKVFLEKSEAALRRVMEKYEPTSKANQNQIVADFLKEIGHEKLSVY